MTFGVLSAYNYHKITNNLSVCYVVRLSFLSKVTRNFLFFLSQQGEKSCVFAVSFVTLEEGISDFITRFNYLRFYGTWKDFFLEEREYGS